MKALLGRGGAGPGALGVRRGGGRGAHAAACGAAELHHPQPASRPSVGLLGLGAALFSLAFGSFLAKTV